MCIDFRKAAKALFWCPPALLQGLELLVQNLSRLDESNEEDAKGVNTTMGVLENLLEVHRCLCVCVRMSCVATAPCCSWFPPGNICRYFMSLSVPLEVCACVLRLPVPIDKVLPCLASPLSSRTARLLNRFNGTTQRVRPLSPVIIAAICVYVCREWIIPQPAHSTHTHPSPPMYTVFNPPNPAQRRPRSRLASLDRKARPSLGPTLCEPPLSVLRFLLKRLQVKKFDENKLYCSEILAMLVNGDTDVQKRLGTLQGKRIGRAGGRTNG